MTESDLQLLLTDLVSLQQRDGFGAEFSLSLVEKERFDQLVIHVPWSLPPLKLQVGYADYPAIPTVQARSADPFATVVATEIQQRIDFSAEPIPLSDIVDMILATASREQLPHLRVPITDIRFPEAMYEQILGDYSQYAPNEYAFICSGTIADGVVDLSHYYPGEMAVSTPVYCELTPEFIDKTVYDDMPKAHTIIVWGHVHPIESPSGTDADSFDDLAAWDREIASLGAIQKRSIALLVSSWSRKATFYDVHTDKLLAHTVITDATDITDSSQETS